MMRICPLCQATYEDDIEFCFKDGSPLDDAGSEEVDRFGGSEEEYSIHDSVEFMPPDADSLLREFDEADESIASMSFDDEDSGIRVVPGGLTSPLDDEESIEAPDPFSMPASPDAPDILAIVSGEFPARPPETLEAEAPRLSDDEGPRAATEPPPVEAIARPPVEPLDEPPESEPEELPQSSTAWLDDVENSAGPAAEPAKPEYVDPVYESIRPTDRARKKGIVWWVGIGVTAVAAIAFLAYALITRGDRRGIEDTGQPTLTVDETPEERPTSHPPLHRDTPTPGDGMAEEDATEGMEEDATEALDEPTPREESPTQEPPTPEPRTETSDRPEPPTPEPLTPEPPTEAPDRPEPPTPAPPDSAANPWLVAANNPTAGQPADPSNPWAAAANAAQNGKMTVSSTPVGADFFVDGQRKGTTPLTVDVPYGHHNVRVEKDGHVSQERPVSVQSGTVFVDFTLEKTAPPTAGKLTVFTNPQPGATLFVDGAARGKTPVTLDITPGVHTLRVELAGFPTKEETIDLGDLQPGENRRRVISME